MGTHLFAEGSTSTVYIKLCRWTVPTMLGGNQQSDLPCSLIIEVGITLGGNGSQLQKAKRRSCDGVDGARFAPHRRPLRQLPGSI